MSKPMIIGLAGRARAGKTTAANMLLAGGYANYEYAFASPIKNMLKAIGIDPEDSYWEAHKTDPIPFFNGLSYRELMQSLGADWGRTTLGDDIWVKIADQVRASLPDQVMLISDVRYDNEAAFVKQNGGKILHIESPFSQEAQSHSSELGFDPAYVDVFIKNNGTLEQLDIALMDIMHGAETRKQISTKNK